MTKVKGHFLVWLSVIVSIIPLGLYSCFYAQLAEKIPIHYNAAGQVDRYVDKSSPEIVIICALGFFGLGFMKFLEFLFARASKKNEENRKTTKKIMNISAFLVSFLFSSMSLYYLFIAMKSMPYDIKVILRLGFVIIGLVILITGNYLPKLKQNGISGFRTKATLGDESLWFQAQRFASKIWVTGGLLMVLTLFLPNRYSIIVNSVILLIIILVPLVYVRSKSQSKPVH